MGPIKETDAKGLMTAPEVVKHLLKSCNTLSNYEPFMFGSSLLGFGSDFDILIIGPSGELLSQLKEELRIAGGELPLDILYMLPEEAEETYFISKEGCIPFSELV